MAEHWAKFNVPWQELRSTDVSFDVYRDGVKFDTLKVSRGAIVWYGRSKQKPRKLNRGDFDRFMAERGRPSKERRK
jgi:hypothetical protein